MTFAVPLFLLAALAAGIPVVLHMISRQRAKELPFSTLRFLRISVEKTRRRRRIHDILLMLLRVAVLLLIALGLARPTITNLHSLLGGFSRRPLMVWVIDLTPLAYFFMMNMIYLVTTNLLRELILRIPWN